MNERRGSIPGRTAAWGRALLLALATMTGCARAPSGGPIEDAVAIGASGTTPGLFSYPRCLDSDGSALWVIDKMAYVQRIDPATGECLARWRMPRIDRGKPTGLTVWRSSGEHAPPWLLIPDTHEHRVVIYALRDGAGEDGNEPPVLAEVGGFGRDEGRFIFVTDVAVLPTPDGRGVERLYISEYGGVDRVSIFEPETPIPDAAAVRSASFRFVRCFGRNGTPGEETPGDVRFSRPQSLAIDAAARELVVNDACNHRVGRFTLEGELIRWFGGEPGAAPGSFTYPYGLALLGDGTALISEFGGNRVQRIDLATGNSLGIYGRAGRGPGEVLVPWGVTAIGDRAYVLDSGNNRVQAFDRPRGRAVLASGDAAGGGG